MTQPEVPMYEAFAAAFDRHAEDSAYNAYYDRKAMLQLIGDVRGLRVLDVGCGPGFYAQALVEEGATVTAFDASPELVRRTRQRVGSRADVRAWDLERPLDWLPDEHFDVAVMALVIHHIDDRARALSEIHRVLRPRGRLVLSTTHPTSDWMLLGGSYFDHSLVEETWQTDWHVRYWRQPLEAWCHEFTEAGFVIERLVEPQPVETMAERYPEVDANLRHNPGFIAFSLLKLGRIPAGGPSARGPLSMAT
ncbi:MAG TPA: class I SAM-dependent methyltransferase [Nocardioidaceae bacterium]|nr:class I SAM-dependent methyltransferase [Nocardioidaceae bacterium]